ncbi:hypothetical protein KDN24_08145 [Bacillus sp. Bva_UNVM-123]|uniref:hypothetical protein n=1 Tax=Bacillus sp. Bva_UNVM-123 TaxID=2829798 RepID=UPI00391F9514
MTPNSIRSFAAGLIVASTVCGIVYFNGPAEAAKNTETVDKPNTHKTKQLSEGEMKDLLTSKGYVVQTESEWNNELAAAKKTDEPKKETEKEKTDTKEKVVYRTILNVSSGMTSIDVGNALKRAKIIDDPVKFSKEVEKKGVETKLRLGIFEIESGMTTDEIISIIFKN